MGRIDRGQQTGMVAYRFRADVRDRDLPAKGTQPIARARIPRTGKMLSARLTAAGRLAIPWLVGPAALLMRDRSLELIDASRCQGLLELASIAALRLNPDLSVGAVFGALHTAVFVGAIAALVALVDRSTHSLAVAGS